MQFAALAQTRSDACVSIHLDTTPLTQEASPRRVERGNMFREAAAQLHAADFDKRRMALLQEHIDDLIDDDDFWQVQANSLCVLVTPDAVKTFRLANALVPMVEVSPRFHLKPLLRAITIDDAANATNHGVIDAVAA